jgi:hypothetical protein
LVVRLLGIWMFRVWDDLVLRANKIVMRYQQRLSAGRRYAFCCCRNFTVRFTSIFWWGGLFELVTMRLIGHIDTTNQCYMYFVARREIWSPKDGNAYSASLFLCDVVDISFWEYTLVMTCFYLWLGILLCRYFYV